MNFIKKYISFIFIFILLVITSANYDKIPNKTQHVNRNKYNVLPFGKLTSIPNKENTYMDDNGKIWIKRNFIQSLLHNPFQNYVFETYNTSQISSSEAIVNKNMFDSGNQLFTPSSFNYYSSFQYPISHFFADILPIIIFGSF